MFNKKHCYLEKLNRIKKRKRNFTIQKEGDIIQLLKHFYKYAVEEKI